MKVSLYCGDGDTFHLAATERDELGLAAGRIPAEGEAVMPPGEARWYRVVHVGWVLGAEPSVEIVAVEDDSWQPIAALVPPGPISGSSRKIGRDWCRIAVGTEARLLAFGGINETAFAWIDIRPERIAR